MFKLSIVITTRNRYADLVDCLHSIEESEGLDFKFEVIVVDDASSDETKEISAEKFKFKNFKVIRNPSQSMMVKTRNKGAREAQGELVLFVDDDNVIGKRMIHELVKFADDHSDFGIIGPKMCYFSSGEPYLNFQKINLYTGKTTGILREDSASSFFESDGIPNVFMVRKKTLEICGYFDEEVVQTFTEPDLAFTARKYGHKCAMISAALTYHRIPVGGGAVQLGGNQFRQKAFFLMRNRTVMVVRYGSILQKISYFLLFAWFWPVAYSGLVLREKRFDLVRLYWRGFFSGIRYLLVGRLDPAETVIKRLKEMGI